MIPEKYRILMNNEIDGVNTPVERDELELYLVRHPEAREHLEELKATVMELDRWETIDPPLDLRDRIMGAVDEPDSQENESSAGRPTPGARQLSWQEFLFGRLRLGYAFSVAAGVMIGLAMHTLIPLQGIGRDLNALDLMRGTSTTELVSTWSQADPVSLRHPGLTGRVQSYLKDGRALVQFSLDSQDPVAIGFRFPETAWLQGITFASNEGFSTTSAPGILAVSGSGSCRFEFLVRGMSSQGINFRLESSEQTLQQADISWD